MSEYFGVSRNCTMLNVSDDPELGKSSVLATSKSTKEILDRLEKLFGGGL